jgi:hypothetical protein
VIYKTRRRYRGEPICADPTADPKENETALHFSAGDRYLWISSYEPVIVSKLLGHPDFRIGHLVLMNTNGRECVVGVVGKLPIGALSIGQRRASDSHEFIVLRKKCSDTRRRRARSAAKKRSRKTRKPSKKTRKEVTPV